jgi:hypothetical protein
VGESGSRRAGCLSPDGTDANTIRFGSMPRYFFHIQDDVLIPDPKGEELANDEEAIDAAQSLAFQLSNDRKKAKPWAVLVVTESGRQVTKVPGLHDGSDSES